MHLLLAGFRASSEKIAELCRINPSTNCGKYRQTERTEASLHKSRHNPGFGMLTIMPISALSSSICCPDPCALVSHRQGRRATPSRTVRLSRARPPRGHVLVFDSLSRTDETGGQALGEAMEDH